ncbi:MarR family winged helix-turn-helix transcriptional regulator [Alcaligenes sp. SDU_A2]|uniref:MarR family winged helix-turn-helix transcriptional regulator n=1 Tax=Alcaligenes sp. SDU_A2 TaxID=3136634 RepID=UPI002C304397|nr:MarR family transcriptional regulator [Alcaligenes sp.]HRL26387.1 MarR family transcriptional regulator [Alcaligenes sp.]
MNLLELKYQTILTETQRQAHPKVQDVELCLRVLSLASSINRASSALLNEFNLSEGRLTLLFLLSQHPAGLSPALLAEQAGVTRATITGLLDGLEQQQLLIRKNNSSDRRVLTVKLTQAGQELCDHLLPYYTEWLSSFFTYLPEELRYRLSGLLSEALQGSVLDDKTDKPYIHDLHISAPRNSTAEKSLAVPASYP